MCGAQPRLSAACSGEGGDVSASRDPPGKSAVTGSRALIDLLSRLIRPVTPSFRVMRAVYRRLPLPTTLKARIATLAGSNGPRPRRDSDVGLPGSPGDRTGWLLSHISPEAQDGLEIGPLCFPLVTKAASGGRVQYVDFSTAEKLREKYKDDPNVRTDEIVETDFLWGRQSLPELVNGRLFDYVIASHVIEHVPNMLGWLREVASVLKDGGLLLLAVPDKRYTFDYKRDLTSFGSLIEAFLLDRRRPGIRDIFYQVSLATRVDTSEAWSGKLDPLGLRHYSSPEAAFEQAKAYLLTDEYNDVHVNILTPASFRRLLEQASQLHLLDFSLLGLQETTYGSCEFLVCLRRLSRDRSRGESLALQLDSFRRPS